MFYDSYTLLQVNPSIASSVNNTKKKQESEEKDDHRDGHHNPYVVFLDNISGSVEEEAGSSGLLGGLKSWLGFAGSMTGAGANVLSEPQSNKPWLKSDKVCKYLIIASIKSIDQAINSSNIIVSCLKLSLCQAGGEDSMTKKAEEHMSKIAGDFCNWLRDLPGDEASVNTLTESQLRALFDTGKNRPTELIQLTNHSSAFIIIDQSQLSINNN